MNAVVRDHCNMKNCSVEDSPEGLRILFCIPTLQGGGAERQLSYLLAGLAARGVEVHLAHLGGGPNLERIKQAGATFHHLSGSGNHDPRLLWQLTKIVRTVKPNIIHTFLTQMDILGGLAGLITDTPFIIGERTSDLRHSRPWKNSIRTKIGCRASFVVANSEAGARCWEPRRRSGGIRVVPNIIPCDEILGAKGEPWAAFGVDQNTEVILSAGRYNPEKNPLALLEAVSLVTCERSRVQMFFFGEGPLQQEMQRRVASQKLTGRINILPYSEAVWSWMKRANVFVSAAIREGCPNAVCEAAIAGCPLVLSDIPAHRELFEDAATLVTRLDAKSIARGIIDVLADGESARHRADVAFTKISQLNSDFVIAQHLSIYKEVCSSRPRPSQSDSEAHNIAESECVPQSRLADRK